MTEQDTTVRRKRAAHVEERLLSTIRSGNLAPGDVLPSERELMRSYSVGRVAIREAMQSLQRKGLVEIRHGGRPRVASPTFETVIGDLNETMRHLLQHSDTSFEHCKNARVVFEAEMARIAAERRSSEDVELLRALVAEQDAAKTEIEEWRARVVDGKAGLRTEYDAFIRIDREFHRAIAGITRNPIIETLCAALFEWLTNFHIDTVRKPGLERLTIAEHSLIVDAIEAREPEQARHLMQQHVLRANGLYYHQHRPSA